MKVETKDRHSTHRSARSTSLSSIFLFVEYDDYRNNGSLEHGMSTVNSACAITQCAMRHVSKVVPSNPDGEYD